MNARDVLEVADGLSMGTKEAEWRAAVSRAYFAAFHAARQLMEDLGFQVPRGEQAHAYLWKRLSNSGHVDVQNSGRDLSDLRSLRNWADYDLLRSLDQTMAIGQVLRADKILGLLETVATSAAANLITETMRAYQRDVLREITWHS